MIPVNQFILGGGDPLLLPSEKMTNSIDEQIAFLQSQKQAINEAYRRNAVAGPRRKDFNYAYERWI